MKNLGFPDEVLKGIRDSVDCNLYFFGNKVETGTMYVILCTGIAVLIGIYVLMNIISSRRHAK